MLAALRVPAGRRAPVARVVREVPWTRGAGAREAPRAPGVRVAREAPPAPGVREAREAPRAPEVRAAREVRGFERRWRLGDLAHRLRGHDVRQ